MNYRVHITPKSGNSKTGPIPVTTTTATTCPVTCPFNNGGGCYAASGPLALHWRKVTAGERGGAWADLTAFVAGLAPGTLWRHNQAGDLPGDGQTIDGEALQELVKANKGRRGFTYTHYPDEPYNVAVVAQANRDGFTVNWSANNLSHADYLTDHYAGPVATVLPSDHGSEATTTPKGRKVIVCPATYKDSVNCQSCGLCAAQDRPIIGFPAHGTQKKKASAVAAG